MSAEIAGDRISAAQLAELEEIYNDPECDRDVHDLVVEIRAAWKETAAAKERLFEYATHGPPQATEIRFLTRERDGLHAETLRMQVLIDELRDEVARWRDERNAIASEIRAAWGEAEAATRALAVLDEITGPESDWALYIGSMEGETLALHAARVARSVLAAADEAERGLADQLAAALRRYGHHHHGCAAEFNNDSRLQKVGRLLATGGLFGWPTPGACTCGYDVALARFHETQESATSEEAK